MPKLDDIYTSAGATLKASDLQGRAVRVVIESYEIVEFDDDKKGKTKKVVLRFQNKEKGLVVNKTNAAVIALNVKSEEVDDWVGRMITLYPTKVDFGGQMVDAIRVKEEVPDVADDPNDPLDF